jgi:hypothetical protein
MRVEFMPVRSIFRVSPLVLVTGLGLALGGCATDVNQAFTEPGWYLEQPRMGTMAYPAYVAGPFSYEACEVKRLEAPRPDRLLCTNWRAKPSET